MFIERYIFVFVGINMVMMFIMSDSSKKKMRGFFLLIFWSKMFNFEIFMIIYYKRYCFEDRKLNKVIIVCLEFCSFVGSINILVKGFERWIYKILMIKM